MQGQHVDSFTYRSCVNNCFFEPWCLAAIVVFHGNDFRHHALPNMTPDTATEADAAMETHLQECSNQCNAALGWLHLWILVRRISAHRPWSQYFKFSIAVWRKIEQEVCEKPNDVKCDNLSCEELTIRTKAGTLDCWVFFRRSKQ